MNLRKFVSLSFILTFVLCSFSPTVFAELKLPTIFGDHMVLQQGQEVPVWGWAEPSEEVRVEFMDQSVTTTADKNGRWQVELAPLTVSTNPATLNIIGSKEIAFKDVLVGEVWLCSGQSNMEWPIVSSGNSQVEIEAGDHPLIRQIKVPLIPSNIRQSDFSSDWKVAGIYTVAHFTAVGYHFAHALLDELNTPIGLINATWGGTRIEPWINRQGLTFMNENSYIKSIEKETIGLDTPLVNKKLKMTLQLDLLQNYLTDARSELEKGNHPSTLPPVPELMPPNHQAVSRLYRGMIHPLAPYAIKGALWYQGESNSSQPGRYKDLKKALVKGWRTLWQQGDFPFYWVQLANYRADSNRPDEAPGWASIRDAQTQAMEIPNSGMAVIIDIGETKNIHPKNKEVVGKRLAQWALTQTYGQEGVPCGPLYKSHEVIGNEIRIHFDYVGQGLIVGEKLGYDPVKEVVEGTLKRFAISDVNKNWVWAEARIDGNTVIVSSPTIDQPVAVRYAFTQNPLGANLYNVDGFPAGPFRTDNW